MLWIGMRCSTSSGVTVETRWSCRCCCCCGCVTGMRRHHHSYYCGHNVLLPFSVQQRILSIICSAHSLLSLPLWSYVFTPCPGHHTIFSSSDIGAPCDSPPRFSLQLHYGYTLLDFTYTLLFWPVYFAVYFTWPFLAFVGTPLGHRAACLCYALCGDRLRHNGYYSIEGRLRAKWSDTQQAHNDILIGRVKTTPHFYPVSHLFHSYPA